MEPLTDEQRATVEANMGLVHAVASKMRASRLAYRDRVQAGTLGLMKAVRRYDPSRAKLSTYSLRDIRGEILEAEARDSPFYVPGYYHDQTTVPWKVAAKAKYGAFAKQARRSKSLSVLGYDRATHRDDPAETIEEGEGSTFSAMKLREAVGHLTPLEREVVERVTFDGETQVDVAARLGVTKQAVHQTRRRAFDRLREMLSIYGIGA